MPYAPVLGRAEAQQSASASRSAAPDRRPLIASISACQQQLAELLGNLDATGGVPEGGQATATEPRRELAQARQAVEETLQRLDNVASGDALGPQLTEFEERVWRRLVEAMRADGHRVEAAVQAEVTALRGDVESTRREHAVVAAELRDARTRDAAARSTELATLDQGIARLKAVEEALHRLDGVVSAEALGTRLTEFEEQVWSRLVEAMRADGHRVEAAVEAEVAALRGDVESARREHATVAAELRDARTRDAAARNTELVSLDKGIARLEADLRRLMATIDDRISHQVRRARLGIDEEMASLRTWVQATIAASTGGLWSTLVEVVRDPMSVVTTVAGLLPRWLVG